jgi:hypothetical protein
MTFMRGGAVWHAMILDEVAGTSTIAVGSGADRETEAGRVDKARKVGRAGRAGMVAT